MWNAVLYFVEQIHNKNKPVTNKLSTIHARLLLEMVTAVSSPWSHNGVGELLSLPTGLALASAVMFPPSGNLFPSSRIGSILSLRLVFRYISPPSQAFSSDSCIMSGL